MVLREEGEALVAVGQPSHAWLSGQLARAWGNERVGAVWPWEEVCLGAEQHDLGMSGWDLEPELNRETGRPRSFMEMALPTHLALWDAAPRRMRAQSRYAALLVSMHGTGLYGRRNLDRLEADEAQAVRDFLARQEGLQTDLLRELRDDPAVAATATDEVISRNRRLVWTWDALSLALLLRWAPHEVDDVPSADDSPLTLTLAHAPAADSPERHTLDPWPFAADRVEVRCEGRRLAGRFDDEGEMRTALTRAQWATLVFELVPARAS